MFARELQITWMKLPVERRNLKGIMQKIALVTYRQSVIQRFCFKSGALSVLHQWAATEGGFRQPLLCQEEDLVPLISHCDPVINYAPACYTKEHICVSSVFCSLKKAISCFRNPISIQDYQLISLSLQRKGQ